MEADKGFSSVACIKNPRELVKMQIPKQQIWVD